MGDDNALTLEVSAENQGEGAYEAELHVYPPQQADFTGVVRSQVGGSSPGDHTVGETSNVCSHCAWGCCRVFADSQPAVLRLQEGEPDQDGGV